VDYLTGYVPCVQHSPAKLRASLQLVSVLSPFHVVGIDHIGPLPMSRVRNRFAVTFINYFSSFAWVIPIKDTSTAEATKALQLWRKWTSTNPLCLYLDPGSSFMSKAFEALCLEQDVVRFLAPAKSHSSVGKIEVLNRIFQQVVNKSIGSQESWNVILEEVMRNINGRCIQALEFSSFEILYGCSAHTTPRMQAQQLEIHALKVALESGSFDLPDEELLAD
jgi:hypothetical protein